MKGRRPFNTLILTFFGRKMSISKQNGCNSLKLHATDLQLSSKFSSGRWPLIYEVNRQDLKNKKDI